MHRTAAFTVIFGLLFIQPLSAQQIISEKWDGCGQTPGPGIVIGSNGTINVADWHELKNPEVVQKLLAKALQQGMSKCPTGNSVGVGIYQPGMNWTHLIFARWTRATGQWEINSNLAMFAQREEQAAAVAKARQDQQEQQARVATEKKALQKQFAAKYIVDSWVSQDMLRANAFIYKDKVVATRAEFVQMTGPNEARFGFLLLTNVNPTDFTTPGQPVVVAIKVLGIKPVKWLGTDDVILPYGHLLGGYKCQRSDCNDFLD